jgi:hypothetical protein
MSCVIPTEAYFTIPISHGCFIIVYCSQSTDGMLIATTPAIDSNLPIQAITHLAVNLIFSSGLTVHTDSFFDYRPNPVVIGLFPSAQLIR